MPADHHSSDAADNADDQSAVHPGSIFLVRIIGLRRSAVSQDEQTSEREQNSTILSSWISHRQTGAKQFLKAALLLLGRQGFQEGP